MPEPVLLHALAGRYRVRISHLRHDPAGWSWLESRLKANPGVTSYRLNRACQSATIAFTGSSTALLDWVAAAPPCVGPGRHLSKVEAGRPGLDPAGPGTLPPLQSLGWALASLLLAPTAGPGLALPALLVTGWPIWRRALLTLVTQRRLNVDFLDGLALAIAVLRRQPATGALMALMVHLGDVVRDLTAGQSRGQVRRLLDFQTVQARVVDAAGKFQWVAAHALCAGQRVRLMAGDLVPADGDVVEGSAEVDQRQVTGESVPALLGVGARLFAGSSVVHGAVTVLVTASGDDTVVSGIVDQIQKAPVGDTRIQNYAEQLADRLVAPLLGVNVAMLAATGNVDRFMSMAIVDYGTGIRISAPTSVLASMTRAAREGILIKSGRHVEHLARLDGIAFDKTGTLTRGRLQILDVRTFCPGLGADDVLWLAAAAENQLRHPVAQALVARALTTRSVPLPDCQDVQFTMGLGVAARLAGQDIRVGSVRYLRQCGFGVGRARAFMAAAEREGQGVLLVALDGSLIGAVAFSDAVRPEALAVVAGLRARGLKEIVMLTGDREAVARKVARALGIRRVYAEVLPAEKADIVRALRAAHGHFAMVGDGVNDSPALAQADVGIALAEGADIARAAADVVLMEDGLHLLLPAIDISRQAMSLVRQNYAITAVANSLALGMSVPSGWMSPMACTLLSNGSALLAAANAMRPLLASRAHRGAS